MATIKRTTKVRPGSIAWMYYKHKQQIKLTAYTLTLILTIVTVFTMAFNIYSTKQQTRYEDCMSQSSSTFCIGKF